MMKVQEDLKARMMEIGMLLESVAIGPEFWDPDQPYWQNTNNHVMLSLRGVYQRHEYDEEMKKIFGGMLDKMVWVFVNYPEFRARISWMTWFMQMYVIDKQFAKENAVIMKPEIWTDPRQWKLADGVDTGLQITVDKVEDTDDSVSGLAVEGSH